MNNNLILMTDSYKASHFAQYPPGTTYLYSYMESRGGEYPDTLFFGLQYLIHEYLFNRITAHDIDVAADFFRGHGEPFPLAGWRHVLKQHGGLIPLKIRAVPEGTVLPNHNIMLDVESTDPAVFWMVTWFETMIMRLWYPITVATQSYFCKKTIKNFLDNTADDTSELDFKLHDFGARGVSSHESAMLGGAAHLVNFKGSDTVEGVRMAKQYYDEPMAGFSIPAAEHSTITAWGKTHEADAFRNMLHAFGGSQYPLISVVSDSYDIYNAVSELWGTQLHDEVVESGKILIVRPDSGDPPLVVKEVLERLDAKFGHTINTKGYRVLNNVRVIQGDGINRNSIYEILSMATNAGYSATNVAFGMGGALLQQVNRDTQKMAYKCAEVEVAGTRRMIFKQPITDLGKKSKAGRMDLIRQGNRFETVPYGNPNTILEPVYHNGSFLRTQTLAEIREIAWPST